MYFLYYFHKFFKKDTFDVWLLYKIMFSVIEIYT